MWPGLKENVDHKGTNCELEQTGVISANSYLQDPEISGQLGVPALTIVSSTHTMLLASKDLPRGLPVCLCEAGLALSSAGHDHSTANLQVASKVALCEPSKNRASCLCRL